MSWPFQLGTQASPPISVTTNGPIPTFTVCATRVRRRIDHGDRVLPDQRHPDLAADDVGIAERGARASGDRRDDRVRLRVDPRERPSGSSPRRRPRGCRPAGAAADRDRRERRVFVAGSTRMHAVGSRRPDRAERPDDARRAAPAASGLDDAVRAGIDALELALAVGGRPGGAEGEGGVVGRACRPGSPSAACRSRPRRG